MDRETRRTLKGLAAALRAGATDVAGKNIPNLWYRPLGQQIRELLGDSPSARVAVPNADGHQIAAVVPLGAAAFVEAILAEEEDPGAAFAGDLIGLAVDLLDEPELNPAAPIMLAGAAVEQRLRSRLVEALDGEEPRGRGIEAHAKALRRKGVLSKAGKGRCDVVRDARNAAAHGDPKELAGLTITVARVTIQTASLVLAELDGTEVPVLDGQDES